MPFRSPGERSQASKADIFPSLSRPFTRPPLSDLSLSRLWTSSTTRVPSTPSILAPLTARSTAVSNRSPARATSSDTSASTTTSGAASPPLAQSRQPGADEKVVLRSPWICDWPGCKRDFIQRSALIVHQRTQSVSLSPSQTLIGELIRGTTARANGRTDVRSAAATRPSAIPAVSLATDACVPASRALRIRTPLRSAYARRFILASGLTTAPSRLV